VSGEVEHASALASPAEVTRASLRAVASEANSSSFERLAVTGRAPTKAGDLRLTASNQDLNSDRPHERWWPLPRPEALSTA
jgi:hypothetical protein